MSLRLNKDGIPRFHSINDINRGLAYFRKDNNEINRIIRANPEDKISRLLTLRDFILGRRKLLSHMLMATYDFEVLHTLSTTVDILSIRNILNTYLKSYDGMFKKYRSTLTILAEMRASQLALHLPNSLGKVLSQIKCNKIDAGWEFVSPSTNKFLLCCVYELQGVELDIPLKVTDGAMDIMSPHGGLRRYESNYPHTLEAEERISSPLTILVSHKSFSPPKRTKRVNTAKLGDPYYIASYLGPKSWIEDTSLVADFEFIPVSVNNSESIRSILTYKGVVFL